MRVIYQKQHHKTTSLDRVLYSSLGILLLLTILSAISLTIPSSSALEYSTSTTAAVHVLPTCSIATNPDGTDTPHTTSLINGGVDTNIGVTTIQTFCNDAGGYAIYAVGYTGDAMTGGNNTHLHNASDGSSTTNDILTGITLNGTVSNWAMKLASGTDGPTIQSDTEGSFASFHTVPSTFTPVAKYTNGTVSSIDGSIMTTTYGASISRSQAAGTYIGKVKYVLVHPNTFAPGTYTIAYNANGGTGTMNNETDILNYEIHNLAANGFTAPTGGTFLGWCTSNASMFDCNNGMSYDPGQTVASLGDANTTVNLYAYWRIDSPMQNFTCENSGLPVGGTKYLYDTRDNNVYLVGKLADNKCWMLDNLRLDPTTTAISASDTNASADAITNYYNDTAPDPAAHPGWSTLAVINTNPGVWTNTFITPQVNTAWNGNNKDSIVANHYGTGSGKRGVYYNYCAATVGTYCYEGGQGTGNASMDICPASWHMPTGGDSGEYQALCNALDYNGNGTACTNGMSMVATNTKSLQYNLSLPLSGYLDSDLQSLYDNSGFWWSSTRIGYTNMYRLYVNASQVWPMANYARDYGLSIRCLANS